MNTIAKYAMEKIARVPGAAKALRRFALRFKSPKGATAQYAAHNQKSYNRLNEIFNMDEGAMGTVVRDMLKSGDPVMKARAQAMVRYGLQNPNDLHVAWNTARQGGFPAQQRFWSHIGAGGIKATPDGSALAKGVKLPEFTAGRLPSGNVVRSLPQSMLARSARTAATPTPGGAAAPAAAAAADGSWLGNTMAGMGQFTGDALTAGGRGAYNVGRAVAPYALTAGIGAGAGAGGAAYMHNRLNKQSAVVPTIAQAARKIAPKVSRAAGEAVEYSTKAPMHEQHAALAEAVRAGHISPEVLRMWQRSIPRGATPGSSIFKGKVVPGVSA